MRSCVQRFAIADAWVESARIGSAGSQRLHDLTDGRHQILGSAGGSAPRRFADRRRDLEVRPIEDPRRGITQIRVARVAHDADDLQ